MDTAILDPLEDVRVAFIVQGETQVIILSLMSRVNDPLACQWRDRSA